jgi:hypothetical protein
MSCRRVLLLLAICWQPRPLWPTCAAMDDLVVVSELPVVERPARGRADLRLGCPLVAVVVRLARLLRGPSVAPRALMAWSVWHHGTSEVRPISGDRGPRGQAAVGGAAVGERAHATTSSGGDPPIARRRAAMQVGCCR